MKTSSYALPTRPTNPVLVSFPAHLRREAWSAALAPLGLALVYRPDPRPLAPPTVNRTASVGGAL
jgi:hypothetical protein